MNVGHWQLLTQAVASLGETLSMDEGISALKSHICWMYISA